MKIGISKNFLYYRIPQRVLFSFVYGFLVLIIGIIVLAITYWLFALLVYKKEAILPSDFIVYIVIYGIGVISRLMYEIGSIWFAYKDSTLQVTDKTVDIIGGGFHKITISYPLDKISLAVVHQSITERLFGIGTVIISGEFMENTLFVGASIHDANTCVKYLLNHRKSNT